MPDPTVPVPISDLLAAIERIPHVTPMKRGQRDLIVRGVRDLAARVETLEQALEQYGTHDVDCHVNPSIGVPCICGLDAALAGRSTTETPS